MRCSNPRAIQALSSLAMAVLLIACAGFASVLVLALFQTHRGLTPDQIVVFYVAPALALAALVTVLRSSWTVRLRAAWLLLLVGGTLVAAESALTVAEHLDERRAAASERPAVPSMLEVVRGLRTRGDHAVPTVPGNVLVNEEITLRDASGVLHPLAPSPRGGTAVLCVGDGGAVTYSPDRFGFNNPDDAWSAPPIDVAMVGDSHTHGVCVDREHQAATHLRRRWSVLNLGVRGAGPLQTLAITREYAAATAPRVVVWTFFEGNDLWDLQRELERKWLTDYLTPGHSQGLRAEQDRIDRLFGSWVDALVEAGAGSAMMRPQPRSFADRLRNVPRLATLRGLSGIRVRRPSRAPVLGPVPDVLDAARRTLGEWGGHLAVAYIPDPARYATRLGGGHPALGELRAYADARDIPFVDLHAAFTATGDPRALWDEQSGHLNPHGYRLVADAIAAAIERIVPEASEARRR